jgi:hypothetical protein
MTSTPAVAPAKRIMTFLKGYYRMSSYEKLRWTNRKRIIGRLVRERERKTEGEREGDGMKR